MKKISATSLLAKDRQHIFKKKKKKMRKVDFTTHVFKKNQDSYKGLCWVSRKPIVLRPFTSTGRARDGNRPGTKTKSR